MPASIEFMDFMTNVISLVVLKLFCDIVCLLISILKLLLLTILTFLRQETI